MVTTTKKNRFDLVTNVDKTIQQRFQQFLTETFPEHQLFAEEKPMKKFTLMRDMYGLWIQLMEPQI